MTVECNRRGSSNTRYQYSLMFFFLFFLSLFKTGLGDLPKTESKLADVYVRIVKVAVEHYVLAIKYEIDNNEFVDVEILSRDVELPQ